MKIKKKDNYLKILDKKAILVFLAQSPNFLKFTVKSFQFPYSEVNNYNYNITGANSPKCCVIYFNVNSWGENACKYRSTENETGFLGLQENSHFKLPLKLE